jgi:hypothetical protein
MLPTVMLLGISEAIIIKLRLEDVVTFATILPPMLGLRAALP